MSTPPPPVDPATPPTPQAPPTPAPPAPPAPQPPAPPTGPAPAAEDVNTLPPWAQKVIADARADAAKARTGAKQTAAQEARAELLRQLSGDAEQPLTPEQLQQQLAEARTTGTAAQQTAASAARELAVLRTAQRLGANGDALLDSRAFMATVDGLDTADPAALTTAVTAQITAALTANPALRAVNAGRSGGDYGGSASSGDGPLDLAAQIEAATKARDFGRVIALKRQLAAQSNT